MQQSPDYSFVFVCQKGQLEIQSMLLASSIARFVSCSYELVAAVPQPTSEYGEPDSSTLDMLSALGARVEPIWNQVEPSYRIGNKISALRVATHGRRRVFLDTDVVCMRPFAGDSRLDVEFGAVPAAIVTWGKDLADWERAYALFGLTLPAVRAKTVRTKEEMAPYYNAGFLVVASDVADRFAEMWLHCAQTIDREASIPSKRPWLDQIALPIAVTRAGLEHCFLDETFNCPGSVKLLRSVQPYFCHYHSTVALKRVPVLKSIVMEAIDRHPALEKAILRDGHWRDVLSTTRFGRLDRLQAMKDFRRTIAPRGTRRDRLTTGVMRSARRLFKAFG